MAKEKTYGQWLKKPMVDTKPEPRSGGGPVTPPTRPGPKS